MKRQFFQPLLLLIFALVGLFNTGCTPKLLGAKPALLAALSAAASSSDITGAASLTISDAGYDYGTVIVGMTPTKVFTITNSGTLDATLGTISTAGLSLAAPYTADTFSSSCATGGTVTAGGGTCTLAIVFTPASTATFTDTIVLGYTDIGGTNTSASRAITGNGIIRKNLDVQIELSDAPLNSSAAPTTVTFARSRTTMDTSYYDGTTLRYYFQVVASNTDAVDRGVYLVDSSGTVVSSINVLSTYTTPTSIRSVAFTPTVGADNYRVRLEGTGVAGQLIISSARIIVSQTNATKTRLYIPLLAGDYNNLMQSDEYTAQPAFIGSAVYTNDDNFSIWLKNSSAFGTLPAGTPWTFETVIQSSGVASASLFNKTAGTQVTATEVTTAVTTVPTLLTQDFADNATNFTDTEEMEVRVKDTGAGIYVYKAALWVTLNPIVKGEVYLRVSKKVRWLGGMTTESRGGVGSYSSPTVYFEITGANDAGGAGVQTAELYEVGSSSGTAGASLVAGSTLTLNSLTKTRQRSAALTLGNLEFFLNTNQTSGGEDVTQSLMVIGFQ